MTENKQTKIQRLLCIVLAGILTVAILYLALLERHEDKIYADMEINISLDSGFYAEDRELTIGAPQGTEVYYTDNCELPGKENGIRYTAPILLTASAEEKTYVYRFKAFYKDGGESEVFTRTYFMGESIDERYTTNVLHITGDPEGLFGYEEGIFATGRIFDEFIENRPDIHFGNGVNANFMQRGRDWEREVYIQYFDEAGRELLAQNGGIRINGRATRMKNQKSFQLYARKEYDTRNEFDYIFLKGFGVREGRDVSAEA